MTRDDLSDKLIHLTRGDNLEAAAETFFKIVDEGKLRGGSGFIKGQFNCVCFTEAPIGKLAQVLANRSAHGHRYAPYGVIVDKSWLFQRGGRPVVYQTESEYDQLPEEIKYRHVTYDPTKNVDFTWEREWRIRTDELILEPDDVTLVVPDRVVKDVLIDSHYASIWSEHEQTQQMPDAALRPYSWHFIVLSDLGVKIKCL